MALLTASRRDTLNTPVAVLTATALFGLLLGWATYGLHGLTPVLDRATNSTSTWIIWTAAAGALFRSRRLAVWGGALMMLATCCGYYAASALGGTFGSGGARNRRRLGGGRNGRRPPCWDGRGGPYGAGGATCGRSPGPLSPWWCWGRGSGWGWRSATGGEATVFLAVGAVLAALLTVYLARTGARRSWLCAVLAPVGALVFYLAERTILHSLIETV